MRVLQINLTYNVGSTGKITRDINELITRNGDDSFMVVGYSYDRKDNLHVMEKGKNVTLLLKKDIFISRLTGRMGYNAKWRTRRALKVIKKFNPDIIHLHNIHGSYINIFMLFNYIKKHNIPVVWTLHDCWSFTGRCSHFEANGCYQWKEGCEKCSKAQLRVYPISYHFDHSKKMYVDKKNLFTGLNNCTLVTPSKWLQTYVKQSYLNCYPSMVINNGIDLDKINNAKQSDILKDEHRKIILGVASTWTKNKGLPDFIEMDKRLDHDKYVIVLVGLNKTQMEEVPNSIIKFERTNNFDEMVEIYKKASVFVNPTYQDNYPTVNLESIACGTKVVTYNTGGSVEIIRDGIGYIVEKGNVDELFNVVIKTANEKKDLELFSKYSKEYCDKNVFYQKYIDLYKQVESKNE